MKYLAIALITDRPNGNGRIYPKEEVEKALEVYRESIKAGKAFGVLTTDPSSTDCDVESASHRVIRADLSRDSLEVEIEVLETESGKALANLIRKGSISFRTAGSGVIDPENRVLNYKLESIFATPKQSASPLIQQ